MRHHFGDFLDRDEGYWTIVPNRERHAYRIGDVAAGDRQITIVTIGKEDAGWARVLTLPNLEELTLHEPTKEQLLAVAQVRTVKRLRITHARPRTIDFIGEMGGVEELVLEYVSGFSDLAPLARLANLRALHVENLRGVSDFGGLRGVSNLRYLAVYGTTDWNQPIEDVEFLRGLPRLEVLALWTIDCRADYPAMLPALGLRSLKKIRLHRSYLAAEEYALLEEALPEVEGANWGPYRIEAASELEVSPDDLRARLPESVIRARHPEVRIHFNGKRVVDDPASLWVEFTGKGARRVKAGARAEARCREYAQRYDAMKAQARALIQRHRASG